MKRILFIGLGSIGQRHLRNILNMYDDVEIDALRTTSRQLPREVENRISHIFKSYDDIDKQYDCIFITNPTNLHYETLRYAINFTNKIFLEKPVFSEWNVDTQLLGIRSDTIVYVAAPLRYTAVFKYLKEYLKGKKIFNIRSICSSYLPEWRPNTDYRNGYSARKDMGGDIELELIHEWDYLVELFGIPNNIYYISGKYSNLEINSNDIATYIGEYNDKLVNLTIDYFGRYSRREIELYLADEVVIADFVNSEIRFLKSKKIVSLPEERDTYQIAELKYFFALNNVENNSNNVNHALKVLKLARGIIR